VRRILASTILLLTATIAFAQTAVHDTVLQQVRLDSAIQLVQKHREDSIGVKTLIWLSQFTESKDAQKSLHYLKEALQLSIKNKLPKSTIDVYDELGTLYHNRGQYDSSIFFHRKALALTIADNGQRSDAYKGIAINLLWLGDYDSAKLYLGMAKTVAEKNNDFSDLAGIYNNRGNVFLQQGNHGEALRSYILSAKIQDSVLHDPLGQSRALANIGNVQYLIGDFDKALTYAKEGQAISMKYDLSKIVAYTSQLIGRIYRKQKKFNEALLEYEKALTGYKKLGLVREVSETYSNMGNIYFDIRDFNKAQEKYRDAIRMAKKSSNNQLLGRVYTAMGSSFHELKNYQIAIAYLDSAKTTAKKVNDPYTMLDSYEVLADIYEDQGKYKESLSVFQKFTNLKDSLSEAESKSETLELELKYQDEKKTGEINLLKSNQKVQALALSRQRVLIASIAIALISIMTIGFLLVNRYRVMNRTKRLLEIEKVRNNIARDLHDDIGSTLSSINILSQVALTEKNGDTQNYLQRIGNQSARMMEDMGDMVWSINPRNDSIHQVVTHMREFATEILESKNIEYHFVEDIKEGVILTAEQRKNLFLIFKETINNATKYSSASRIEINLQQQDHTLVLRIKDNGQGFDEQKVKTGNGLRNLRERAKEINATLILKSAVGNGTKVELKVPIA
jgi:two-component system, NarL family, sensor histidine kinase UhpB